MDLPAKKITSARNTAGSGLQWVQSRCPQPQGLVFIPPLIGGGPAQQLGYFRWLRRYHLNLFSFNYTGHGHSTGRFSLEASLRDTRRMLSVAAGQAQADGVPLYGIAACYATIPMLCSALVSGEPFKKIVLINPLPALYPGTFLHALCRRMREDFAWKTPVSSLKNSLDTYLEALFPNVAKSSAGFGSLSRKRTRILKVLVEWFSSKFRLDFSLPQTPAMCIYSQRDPILNSGGGTLKASSMNGMRRICSPVTFHAIDSDHFLSDAKSRTLTRQAIRAFLLVE